MTSLAQDLRFAARILARNKTFTATAILALALGIGATSAAFSVLYGVLLRPLPYREPERLVRVYVENPRERFHDFPLSPADFLDYRARAHVFQEVATYVRQDQQYGGDHPECLVGLRVSYGYFRLFGVAPLLGRDSTREEESTPNATSVVIVSYGVWKHMLGGNPRVIGSSIRLSDSSFQVVGVMRRDFADVSRGYRMPSGHAIDVWLPLDMLGRMEGVPRAFHYCNTL